MEKILNIKNISIFIIIILIIFILISKNNFYSNIKSIIHVIYIHLIFKSPADGKLFFDQNDNKLNPLFWERSEQYYITKYLEPNDCVLELGGRYGVASYCVQSKLKNKKLHLVVEPDNLVLKSLYKNIKNNSMECKLFNGTIGKKNVCFQDEGIGSFTYECNKSNIKTKNLYDLEFGRRFNTLIIDCEGCFISFFHTYRNYILKYVTKIIIETDRVNYDEVFNILLNNKFKIADQNLFKTSYLSYGIVVFTKSQ